MGPHFLIGPDSDNARTERNDDVESNKQLNWIGGYLRSKAKSRYGVFQTRGKAPWGRFSA